ncbi:MAG: class I SAM-dependent methyltransferase [Gammaproteobacteria bacterium]
MASNAISPTACATKNGIAIVGESIQLINLASTLQLPLLIEADPQYEFLLLEHDQQLTLCWQAQKKPIFLTIDFVHGQLAYRQKQALSKEAVVKAVGAKGIYKPSIIDATAGLGRDAFILATTGCKVTMIEQHPIIAALLQDGLTRLLKHQALDLQLQQGKAESILSTIATQPDVVYLDPMFPSRNKTALVKKDMQILQQLTHNDIVDNETLLQIALQCATKRVVVKRPHYAPTLTEKTADFAIRTTYHRFDIYQIKQSKD